MKKIILSIVTVITLFGVTIFGITSIHNANTSSATPSTLPSSSLTSSALTNSKPEETNGVTNITTIKNPENVTNSPIKFEGLFSKNSVISSTSTDPSLISFLRITINSGVAYDTISIQCINSGVGATTYDLKEDEYGTTIGDTKSTIYYFTRQASYTVILKKSNEIVASAQCSFSPVINETALQTVYENIQYYDGNYYILGNGSSEITPRVKTNQTTSTSGIQFDTNLYLLSINNASVSASDNLYKLTLPANSFGDVKLTFTSKTAYVTRTITLKVVNPKYSWTFLNSNEQNITENSRFGSFYVFNEAIKLQLVISNTLIDASKYNSTNGFDTTFTSTPLTLTNLLTVKTTESVKNIANTTTSQTLNSVIEKKDTSSVWTETFDQRNHSIFTISTNLLSTDFVVSDNVVTYKIITKLPYTYGMDRFNAIGGRYDLAIYQHSSGDFYGGVKNEIYNYLNGALDGILTRDTVIYFLSESTTIYNNGSTSILVKFDTSFKTVDPTEDLSPFRDTLSKSEKEKTVQIKNKDFDTNSDFTLEEFETFYSFTFTSSYYPPQTDANDRFYSNIISSSDSAFTYTSTDRNGNTLTAKSDLNKNYIFTMFKSNVSDTNFLSKAETISSMPIIEVTGDLKLPVYMNIVYNFNKEAYDATNASKNIFWDDNGFENLYQLQKGDKIEFFEPGIYIVELYTFPTHEFAKNFVNRALTTGEDSLLNNNYIRFEFEVEGPSISATSTNNQGVTIPLANRMFTETDVRISIQLTPNSGQRLIAYRNNIQINSFDSDSTFIMNRANYAGSWTFTVFNKDGVALKSLNFTIIDTAYLGYSINNREEYNSLEVFDSAGNKLPSTHCYDLIDEGNYTVKLTNSDKLAFYLTQDGVRKTTYVEKPASNVVRVNIQKPYFDIKFTNDFEGDTRKTTSSISIGEVSGIEISKVTVFLNGKQIDEYDPRETTGGIGGIIQSGHSYSQNGVYTIRITDKFNNSFEVQAEKYYKINYALIILIAIAVFAFLFLIWFIYRSRRGIKVR